MGEKPISHLLYRRADVRNDGSSHVGDRRGKALSVGLRANGGLSALDIFPAFCKRVLVEDSLREARVMHEEEPVLADRRPVEEDGAAPADGRARQGTRG
jgi:hypothetical protein